MTARWEQIGLTVLSGDAETITLSNISDAYRKLRLVCYFVNDGTLSAPSMRFNGDSATNYTQQRIKATGVTVGGNRLSSRTNITLPVSFNPGANEPTLAVATIIKPVSGEVARVTSRAAGKSTAIDLESSAGEWTNTADLITSLSLTDLGAGGFAAGTRVVLYGSRDTPTQ